MPRRLLARLTAALLAGCLQLSTHAQSTTTAPPRGWLRFADGNAVSGVLLSRTPGGGVMKTDRFGDLPFLDSEARFEPAPAATNAPPGALETAPTTPGALGWRPATWSIGVSGYWQHKGDSTTSDLELDLDATWRSRHDELQLALSADYKVVDNAMDNNEQTGSLRWVRDLNGPWVGLVSARLQRSTLSIDPLPTIDYLLVQGTAGAGWRQAWSTESHTLVALNLNRVALDLLRYDRRVYDSALSLLVENHLRLGPRVRFDGTLHLYRWRDGSSGIDSSTELSYDLTESIRVGLRHESRRNAVSLDFGRYNRLSLTTRVAF